MGRFLQKLILIGGLLLAAFLAWGLFLPVGPAAPKLVQLKPRSSAHHIAAELKQQGIIRSQIAFLLWHYLHGHKPLKAGEYYFDHAAGAREVYARIASGDIYFHTVVVPEGFNMFDIASALQDAGLGRREDFLQVARTDTALIRDLDPAAPTLEGYLFPDTYHFTRTQSMRDIAAVMVHRFRQSARELGLTSDIHRIVTMGSIVEKETAASSERPEVASVFYNRLARHMPLQTDPSVIYAALLANRYRGAIYQSDLKFQSPYNTYLNSGLPPGPICNPGKQALQAAMHPASTDYLYFVSDNQGHHNFASTEAQHERNVAAYRHAVAQDR